MEKNKKQQIQEQDQELDTLLQEYYKQAAPKKPTKHGYSELYHSDYGNYSDSCCC